MNLDELGAYERIVIWGAGNEFCQKYKKQFHVSFCVDRDTNKHGKIINGIKVRPIKTLEQMPDKNLFVISSLKYYDEIYAEIQEKFPGMDIVKLDDMLNIFGSAHQSFCLWGIDAFVRDIFLRGGYKLNDISYIEVGANHPFFGSATASLYLGGACGILIEPNPDLIPILRHMRPRDIVLNCGIGKENGEMTFYRMDNSYRNSFDFDVVQLNVKRGFYIKDEIRIPVQTIDWIMEQYSVNAENTYLSIPSMGGEKKALSGFEYRKFHVPVVSIGFNSEDVLDMSIFNDYEEIGAVPRHKILVRKDLYKRIMG